MISELALASNEKTNFAQNSKQEKKVPDFDKIASLPLASLYFDSLITKMDVFWFSLQRYFCQKKNKRMSKKLLVHLW